MRRLYPISNAFLQAVQENTRSYYWTGRITTKAGVVHEFSEKDIVKGSGYISSQCCGSTEMELGTVYSTEMGITLLSEIDRYTLERQVLVNLMAGGILEPAVFNRENNELLAEMNHLQEEREKLAGSLKVYKKQAIEAQKLLRFVMKQEQMTQFQDEVFLEYVDEITVLSREEIVFSLRCGLELKERLVN